MIHHVSIETRPADVDAEVAFWALLGFERVDPPDGLLDVAAWVERAGTQVHLLFTEQPVAAPQGHVAVVAEDYEAAVTRLEEAGFPFEPRRRHWGAARGVTTTPGGHRVEVMAAPPW